MFEEREMNRGIFFVGSDSPKNMFDQSIESGDSVDLRVGHEKILVRSLVCAPSGTYRGVIYGFEPSLGIEYRGLKLGQEIEFSGCHIFGCNKA